MQSDHWSKVKQILGEALSLAPEQRADFLTAACQGDETLRQEVESLLDHSDQAEEESFLGQAAQVPDSIAANRSTQNNQGLSTRCPDCRNPVPFGEETALDSLQCGNCGSEFSLINQQLESGDDPLEHQLDHFQLTEKLGQGGFGTVWKAQDTRLNRVVAIKIPRSTTWTTSRHDQLLREAQAAAKLKHSNIVAVHEVGKSGDEIYIVSDFVDGQTLDKFSKKEPCTGSQAAKLVETLARALQYSHSKGVIHRDLKPGNIMMDADGQPHIMDFGLAKQSAGDVTVTIDGQVMGTPAYMSPEQAAGKAHTAGPSTDIYSLGVVLFEMLTGELPFRGNIQNLIQQVIHDDPPTPRKLNRFIDRDLETICLKCLEKKPAQRYQTADELADDLARFVNREPITARPISVAGKTWRWCQRNPAVAALGVTVGLLLIVLGVGGISAAIYQASLASELKTKNTRLTAATERADANLREARMVVDDFFTQVTQSRELLLGTPGTHELRKKLLIKARDYYTKFIATNQTASTSNDVKLDTAKANMQLGDILVQLSEPSSAIESYGQAHQLLEQLAEESGDPQEIQSLLASCHHRLSVAMTDKGALSDAESESRFAIELWQSLLNADPDNVDWKTGLALAYSGLGTMFIDNGRPGEAEKPISDAIDLLVQIDDDQPGDENDRELAVAYLNLGNVHYKVGNIQGAGEMYDLAINNLQDLVDRFPDVQDYRNHLAKTHSNQGNVRFLSQKLDEAETHFRKSIEIYVPLVEDNPRVKLYQENLSKSYSNLGNTLQNLGRYDDAIEQYELAVDATENPDMVGIALSNMANVYYFRKDYQGAADVFLRVIETMTPVVAASPEVAEYQDNLASAHMNVANMFYFMDQMDTAIEHCQNAIDLWSELTEKDEVTDYETGLARAYNNLGNILDGNKDFEGCVVAYNKAIELWRSLVERKNLVDAYSGLAGSQINLAKIYLRNSILDKADDLIEEAKVNLDEVFSKNANHMEAKFFKQNCNNLEARLRNDMAWPLATHPDESERDGPLSVIFATRACELSNYENHEYLDTLGAAQAETGDFPAAIETLTKAVEMAPEEIKDELQARLDLYRDSKPYRDVGN